MSWQNVAIILAVIWAVVCILGIVAVFMLMKGHFSD